MSISVCSGCNESFASLGSFDAHRTGSHAAGTRRCKTVEEMREGGLEKTKKHWHFVGTGFDFGSLKREHGVHGER
jgi:hypothetical protein